MTRQLITLRCIDRPGIVHAVTTAVLAVNGNITENEQFSDHESGTFCMRMVIETDASGDELRGELASCLGQDHGERLRVRSTEEHPRVLILVSKADHCLNDLLYRWKSGDLPIDVAAVASNHPDCEPVTRAAGLDYLYMPLSEATRGQQEAQIVETVTDRDVDLVVLARYMQVLSPGLCDFLADRAINIHHSFLPSFAGGRPYHQAHARGVKLVGATAHYVTAQLDEGPIIEQSVARVSHAHTVEDLVRVGQDIERVVLARAVRLWAEGRVFPLGATTVVFRS